jgi:drug/metabolite transporter (DMT)-like permease
MGWAAFGESLSPLALLGLALVVLAVALVNTDKS